MLSKDEIDGHLQSLSEKMLVRFGPDKRYRLVLAGGAAIVLNYGFRNMTANVDAISHHAVTLSRLVREVARERCLEYDWLSHNVMVTQSCSLRVVEGAKRYKLYDDVLDVHTVDALTLICMKSVACRPDSHDLEDIVNLLDLFANITFSDIRKRFMYLYGDWSMMSADAQMYMMRRYNEMPPDMVNTMISYLPEHSKYLLTDEELYNACQEVYRRVVCV